MDWKDLVKTVAPVIGTALSGPFSGMAVKAISDALNIPLPTQDNLKVILSNATPEKLAAIKNAEQEFAFKMNQLGFEHEEAIAKLNAQIVESETQDRDSARRLQMTNKCMMPAILTYATIIGFYATIASIFSGYAKVDSVLAGTIIGYLVADYKQVMNFNFGSSASSQNKDVLLAQARQDSRA